MFFLKRAASIFRTGSVYMKKILILVISICCFEQTFANHISGGELFYEYVGPGSLANTKRYKLTMRLFRDCNSNGQVLSSEKVVVGIYHTNGLTLQTSVTLDLQNPIRTIQLNTDAIPCLTNAPVVCYQIGIYVRTIDLPVSTDGYTLSWLRCCRIDDIANISVSTGTGATFTTTIPGTAILPSGINSSPQFAVKDTALVCQNKNFVLDFGASDNDGDSLSYSFCDANLGGTPANPNPGNEPEGVPAKLTLTPLPYSPPFSGASPLGPTVSINPFTGKITGTAPATGRYVINVCVTEWRNGVALNVHRKDFILQIANCDYAAAEPVAIANLANPVPVTGSWCKSFNVTFNNNNTSSTIRSYYWDFGVKTSNTDTSTQPVPNFTYNDTGVFEIKLVVSGANGCLDSGSTSLGVYPGFKADFNVTGSCFKTPFIFADKTANVYGNIQSWKWDFGDLLVSSDVSGQQNDTYKYPAPADNLVSLKVTSSKGCIDSISKTLAVRDVPLLSLPFRDTLICSIDTLLLPVVGTGKFSWSPRYNITDTASANPQVFPKDTTTYYVSLSEDGCSTIDSIKVNVLDSVSVYAGADTTICLSDTLNLTPVSNALQYFWSPSTYLVSEPNIKNPIARPDITTIYTVTASLGKCVAKDFITIKVVPYPVADAGNNVSICYGDFTKLSATIVGASFTWTPSGSLVDFSTLTPISGPVKTTAYTLTVFDTLGCPKPGFDSVVVTVISPVKAFAGNDTAIVAGQPLQLTASGGSLYAWSPSDGMNNSFIANPVIVLGAFYDSIIYKVKVSVPEGCFADDDIKVKVFKTEPDIFIPTAFTPNHDGKNDLLKPIPVGIVSIDYFRVYNRWGQMLYSTSQIGQGWDGLWKGKEQATGTYVFMAAGTNYLGRAVLKKGTVVLIR